MNKQRKTSHILNVFQYDADGHVVLPASLTLSVAPGAGDNNSKVPTTAWVRTYVTGLSYLTGNQSITVSGDATGSGTTSIALTLANTAVTPGTYGSTTLVPVVTVDSKGRITSVTTAAISGSLTFTGDVTGTGTTGTSTGLTLAASGVTAGTYTKVTVDSKGRVTVGASATTSDISEGTNLYYTDARVLSYLSANTYATQSYVNTQVSNLVASAPATLDTLNELAAALGNDAAFSTTVSTALGNRLRVDINTQGLSATLQGYGRTNLGLGTAATSNTGDFAAASHTHSIANVTGLQTALDGKQASGSYAASVHTHIISDVTGLQTALDGKQASLGFTPYNSTNPSGYISSYTETDTLSSVTSRGNSTSTASIFSSSLAVGNSSHYDSAQFSLDVNGGVLIKNTGKTAQLILQNANPASGGNNGFVQHLVGGTTTGAFASIQTYYGASVAAGTLQLQPNGGSVTIGGNTVYHGGNLPTIPTNNNQLTNGAGYITSSSSISGNAGSVTYLMNRTDSAAYPVLWGANYTNTIGTIAYSCAAVTIQSSTGTLTATTFSGALSGNATTASSISGFNNPTTAATANTIAYRDGSGDLYTRYFLGGYINTSDNVDTGTITYIMAKFGDNYHRSATAAKVQAFLGLGSLAYSSATIPTNNNQLTNGAGYITSDSTKLPLAGGTMTGTITITNTDIRSNSTSNWTGEPGTQGKIQYHASRWYIVSDSASDRIVQFRRNGTDTSYISNDGTFIGNISGNAATATTFSTGRTNYKGVTDNAVAGQLMWKNYANNHTIFDASAGTSPDGGAVNNTNSGAAWSATYPTLMGWNGAGTYGVRVDTSRYSESTGSVAWTNVSGRPTAVSSFTNDSGYLASVGLGNITDAHRLFNNMGNAHGTYQDFNSVGNFGVRYMQGSTNGPESGQHYGFTLGLGNDYSISQYATQFYWLRNTTNPYIRIRYQEGGSWGGWTKVSAAYADTAGGLSSMNISQFTNNSGYITSSASISGTSSNITSYTINQSVGTGNSPSWAEGTFGSTGGASNQGIQIRYQNYGSGYGRIRFYQSDSNHMTIHAFSNSWQGGGLGSSNSAGGINIAGENGVTFGGWNVPDAYITAGGTAWFRADVTAYSDARVKENIRPIENALQKVINSRGVLYDRIDSGTKNNIGFIAQELEVNLPELVMTESDDLKSVKYQNMTAVLVEAIKEQQLQIEELKNKLDSLIQN